uniref:HhH-GPD domain-containing protein n=1 Tax=Moniliophthora roreri TaxID=221103 RepID=A0A0W0G2W6_MONRR
MSSCPSTPVNKSRRSTVSSPYFAEKIHRNIDPGTSEDDLFLQLGPLKPLLIQGKSPPVSPSFTVSSCSLTERVANDPWKLLVAVTLLNKTTAKVAIPIFWKLLSKWPSPWALSQGWHLGHFSRDMHSTQSILADAKELADFIHSLGTYSIRSKRLISLSKAYLLDPPSAFDARPSKPTLPSKKYPVEPEDATCPLSIRRRLRYPPTPISHLPGTGSYALDSYRIFCPLHEDPFSAEWKAVNPTDKELILYLRWRWAHLERMEWSPETVFQGAVAAR